MNYRYLKTIVTVIAASLLWHGIKDFSFIADAKASTGVVEVKVVDIDFKSYRLLPVKVQGEVTCKNK